MTASKSSSSPALAKIVERQMRNWELAKSQRPAETAAPARQVADFISISRGVGCPMEEVPMVLGERLGWPVFDREILDAMAGDDETRRQIYRAMDERDLSWLDETLRVLVEPRYSRNDYFHRLTATVLTLARKGPGVFVGRVADLILPPDSGLRVRLVAPRDLCQRHLAQTRHTDVEEAGQLLERLERERAQFIEKHFHQAAHEPARFDLVLNLGYWTPQEAADLILQAREVKRRHP